MVIYSGLSGFSRQAPPTRWGSRLDGDFVQYVVEGLRRLFRSRVAIDIILISGYRTYEQQARLFSARSTRETARPGLSQHEYGYAVDVGINFPARSDALVRVLGAFGIPYEQNPARYSQAILKHFFSDLLYLRQNDPGHMAYYSDVEWNAALGAAGYFGEGFWSGVTLLEVQDPGVLGLQPTW
jgi:hypothetical protein